MTKQTSAKTADQGTAAAAMAGEASTATTATTDEFQNITLDLIIVEKQIRTGANVDDEDPQGFVDSIAARGEVPPPRRGAALPGLQEARSGNDPRPHPP